MNLDLRQKRARQEAQARARTFRPTVARTHDSVIVMRPSAYRGGPASRKFAEWMSKNLPGLRYDSVRGWWVGALSDLVRVVDALGDGANLSRGVLDTLEGKQ